MKTSILLLTILAASAFAADSPYTLELRPNDPASKYAARDAAGRIVGATNIYITQSSTSAVLFALPLSFTNYTETNYGRLVENLSDDGATNMVRALVSSGRFCAVRGHVFIERTLSSVLTSNPPIPVYAERCSICDKRRSFTISNTETVHDRP